jgi:polyisoprenoid-binding protein YceI
MKKSILLIILFSWAGSILAQTKQTISKSTVTFQIKNLGVNTGGSFSGLKGDIQFDPAHPESSSITATIETNTVNTDNDNRDEHLKSDDYFDVAKYPKITMKSVSFKHKSGSNYVGTFSLTIKDKTNTIDLPFTYTETGNTAVFKGSFKIKRSDYGIGGQFSVMSNEATISIEVDTSR